MSAPLVVILTSLDNFSALAWLSWIKDNIVLFFSLFCRNIFTSLSENKGVGNKRFSLSQTLILKVQLKRALPFSEIVILGYQWKAWFGVMKASWFIPGVHVATSYVFCGYELKPECSSFILEYSSESEEFLFFVDNSRVKKNM